MRKNDHIDISRKRAHSERKAEQIALQMAPFPVFVKEQSHIAQKPVLYYDDGTPDKREDADENDKKECAVEGR